MGLTDGITLKADEEPLSVEISRITQTGEIYLEFSKDMRNVSDLTYFYNYTAFSFEIESDYMSEEERDEAIETWEVTTFSNYELIIKLTFKNLLLISATQT
jgi:hypothetical protein